MVNIVNPDFKPEYDAHAADIDAHMADFFQNMLVGNYYFGGMTVGTGVALTANRLYANPFFVATTMTFDRITVNVTTGVAGAMRLGIYNDLAASPTTLVMDCGTVDVTSTAIVYVDAINKQLTKGWYWLAGVSDVAPSIAKVSTPIHGVPLGYDSGFNIVVGGYKAFTYAALPASFGTITTYYGASPAAPFIAMRVKSIP